jgi:hypothetical protein
MWLSLGLALATALVYVLLGLGVMQAGDISPDEAPAGITYVAAACYVAGGLLILARKRRLWIVGAVVNALVILMYVSAYANRPAVLFCTPGLLTKIGQILIQVGLLYLIFTYQPESKEV